MAISLNERPTVGTAADPINALVERFMFLYSTYIHYGVSRGPKPLGR